MGNDSSAKSRLGKIALQQRIVVSEVGQEASPAQPSERAPAPFAQQHDAMHLSDELCTLAARHGMPAVDLTQLTWSLEPLRLVPRELASEYQMLPLEVNDEGAVIVAAGEVERARVDEFGFLIGKPLQLYVTLPTVLRAVVAGVYRAFERGQLQYTADPSLVSSGLADTPFGALDQAQVQGRAAWISSAPPEVDPAFSEPPGPVRTESNGDLAGKAVLLVDPHGRVLSPVGEALSSYGVDIRSCKEGEDALQRIENQLPDLLVIDAELPGMHGFTLCSRLRGTYPALGLPIVIVSSVARGWRYAADLLACFGVEHVFEWPLEVTYLKRALVSSLRGERLADDPGPLNAGTDACLRDGMVAFEQGDLDGAIRCLERGVEAGADVFQLHYHLGLLYGRRGHLFPAIAALENAARIHPRHFSALRNLAVLYQRAGFRHKATETWERAMWSAPDEGTRASIKQHMVGLL